MCIWLITLRVDDNCLMIFTITSFEFGSNIKSECLNRTCIVMVVVCTYLLVYTYLLGQYDRLKYSNNHLMVMKFEIRSDETHGETLKKSLDGRMSKALGTRVKRLRVVWPRAGEGADHGPPRGLALYTGEYRLRAVWPHGGGCGPRPSRRSGAAQVRRGPRAGRRRHPSRADTPISAGIRPIPAGN